MLKESTLMRAFRFTMQEEGGETYTNDPRDPGGPTKYGVALNYNRGSIPDKDDDGDVDARDVQLLEEADALVIYRDRYWRPGKCDALPDALALAHADTLYNIGPGAAPRILQRAVNACGLGIAVDGKIGPATITAIRSLEDDGRLGDLLRAQAAERLYYYKTRPGWPVYGRGWQARTQRCFDTCLSMLGGA
ncbi:glycoside hydrolase family 108 protein [Desulfovibrio piger]|uniref:glycoside hydrolase family 108 protein n=1 Tax=Desulfovibrio piger TaxID=901 RepID=UPI0039F53313